MSFDKFRKFKPTGGEMKADAPKNPYVRKAVGFKPEPEINTDDLGDFNLTGKEKEMALLKTSALDGQNKHLYSQILELQRTVKELKEDLASLYSMFVEPDEADEMSVEDARERYMALKQDARHLVNRKVKKF